MTHSKIEPKNAREQATRAHDVSNLGAEERSVRKTTTTQTSIMDNAASLLKRSSMTNPDKYPLYIFLIIAGCIVGGLIGFSVYTMFHGLDDSEYMKDVSHEQRTYMRETRQRYLNMLAREAGRPDMIVPIRGMDA
ncbi:unnamed protein product [Penicillium crustosum]